MPVPWAIEPWNMEYAIKCKMKFNAISIFSKFPLQNTWNVLNVYRGHFYDAIVTNAMSRICVINTTVATSSKWNMRNYFLNCEWEAKKERKKPVFTQEKKIKEMRATEPSFSSCVVSSFSSKYIPHTNMLNIECVENNENRWKFSVNGFINKCTVFSWQF